MSGNIFGKLADRYREKKKERMQKKKERIYKELIKSKEILDKLKDESKYLGLEIGDSARAKRDKTDKQIVKLKEEINKMAKKFALVDGAIVKTDVSDSEVKPEEAAPVPEVAQPVAQPTPVPEVVQQEPVPEVAQPTPVPEVAQQEPVEELPETFEELVEGPTQQEALRMQQEQIRQQQIYDQQLKAQQEEMLRQEQLKQFEMQQIYREQQLQQQQMQQPMIPQQQMQQPMIPQQQMMPPQPMMPQQPEYGPVEKLRYTIHMMNGEISEVDVLSNEVETFLNGLNTAIEDQTVIQIGNKTINGRNIIYYE